MEGKAIDPVSFIDVVVQDGRFLLTEEKSAQGAHPTDRK